MKKVIIVGATSGIGKGIAQLYAKKGYKVGITGRRIALLLELKQQYPENIIVRSFDIDNSQTVAGHLEALTAELGGLDLLVLSSGTGHRNAELAVEIEHSTLKTNVEGFTAVVVWAFNFFRKQREGQIASITSIAGLRGNKLAPAYSATKAYQMNYLQALRQIAHHHRLPIVVTDVRPGFVDTAMGKSEGVFWSASVPKASRQIVKAIENRKKIVYITKRWRFVALLAQLIPRPLYERL